MHTPSGRFQPSTRLCLSISDFHPKSFNPAWEVSTILIGLLSFMTSEEMTTGSVGATEAERKWAAGRTRWWNSTGGGSSTRTIPSLGPNQKGNGAIKAGDGGAKFRAQWPELDKENWKWMEDNRINPATGERMAEPGAQICSPQAAALGRRPSGSAATIGAVVEGGHAARNAGQSWLRRNKLLVAGAVIFTYVLIARILGEGGTTST
jgi:ubiquitin-conjugating enzyme E2 J2